MARKYIVSDGQKHCDNNLVFLDKLLPMKRQLWKWVVLTVAAAQSMAVTGVWACGGIYMKSMREVLTTFLQYLFLVEYLSSEIFFLNH